MDAFSEVLSGLKLKGALFFNVEFSAPWRIASPRSDFMAPELLPGAGQYSGDYTVEDTGGKVDGQYLDVYMPSRAEAKKFGRQRVKVLVLKYGDDEASPPDPQQKAEAKAVNRAVRARTNREPKK
jgi:3D domain